MFFLNFKNFYLKFCHLSDGFYGNLEAKICNKQVKLQLSELTGNSKIFSTNSSKFHIGLADSIPDKTFIRIKSTGTINASKIAQLRTCFYNESFNFLETVGDEKEFTSKLGIESDNCGSVDLEIKSWIDSLNFKKPQQVNLLSKKLSSLTENSLTP